MFLIVECLLHLKWSRYRCSPGEEMSCNPYMMTKLNCFYDRTYLLFLISNICKLLLVYLWAAVTVFFREHLQITRKFKIHVSEKLISLFFSNLSTVRYHSSLNCWVQHLEERFIKATSGHFSVLSQTGKLNSLSVRAKRESEKNFTYREQHSLTSSTNRVNELCLYVLWQLHVYLIFLAVHQKLFWKPSKGYLSCHLHRNSFLPRWRHKHFERTTRFSLRDRIQVKSLDLPGAIRCTHR